MAAKVIWSLKAHEDFQMIVAYLRQGGIAITRRIGGEIITAIEGLAVFPEKGRAFREFDRPGVRELIHPPYRIIYRFDVSRRVVRILRIWHGTRGTPDLRATHE